MPKSRKAKVWVFLALSLLVAFVLLVVEIRVFTLYVDPNSFNSTLYDIIIFPLWALNAYPAGYVLRLFGLRVR